MGIIGSAKMPMELTLSGAMENDVTTIDLVETERTTRFSGKIMGYYSISGQFVTTDARSLTKGIYIVKLENGKHSKIYIQ